MVAGKNVAVVFKRERLATFFLKNAKGRGNACPGAKGYIEELHEGFPDVAPHPDVVNLAKKIAVSLGPHGPGHHERVAERSRGEVGRAGKAHRRVGGRRGAFDERDKLQVARAVFAEKFVNFNRVGNVVRADDRQRVELGAEAFQALHAVENEVETRRSRAHRASRVVEFARAVDAQPDEEVIVGEECRPIVVEQRAVGLKGIFDFLARGVFFFEREHFFEKIDPE